MRALVESECPQAGETRTRRLRIVSANLWNGAADAGAFRELIEELAADVVAVQELAPHQAEQIGRVLPHGSLEPARDCTGMGIALRRPSRVDRIALPCRDARLAEVSLDGTRTRLEVINVHVQAPFFPFTWTAFRHRRGQLAGLERYLDADPERPRAVVGDFNATPGWPLYHRMAARFADAAKEVARRRGTAPVPTWGPRPGARRLLRIDHAFVGGLAVLDFRVVALRGCDHAAIVVDLAER
jgi:endonuclease/exonuclease/phosphatase (EEP) superfamily protein YafD